MAALYTAAVAPTRPWLVVRVFKCLWIRPTGNCRVNAKKKKKNSQRELQQATNICNNDDEIVQVLMDIYL